MMLKIVRLCLALTYCSFVTATTTAIIGTGYVGLVSGAGLASLGNKMICADVDERKIELLKQGYIPIYEPGLAELVFYAVKNETLTFTTDVAAAIDQADVIIIAVGTPMGEDGSADMTYVKSVVDMIADTITSHKVICTKSTVPVGTGNWIRKLLIERGVDETLFSIASNPEFLREGCAIEDFLQPDRIVIGVEDAAAETALRALYKPLTDQGVPFVVTNLVTSESIKYAANSFLATKLSFINEMANLCDATGADIKTLAYAIGLDRRISPHFLNPGPGFGGSCFPKDCQALIYTAQQYGVPLAMIQTALDVNEEQKKKPVEKLLTLLPDVRAKTIAVLGLAFKGNTDDIRYSPAITTIKLLLEKGAIVRAYDAAAMPNMKKVFPTITYTTHAYEALTGADAAIIMTEWEEFRALDLVHVADLMHQRIIVDARNMLDTKLLRDLNFAYATLGKK